MTRFLSTTYCDDIRQEVGGKLSLIGVYNGMMFVPQFPVTLPKFWILATYVVPHDEPPKSLKIRVLSSQMHVCFSPLVLAGPCTLRVVAITDRGEVRGLGLQIQQQAGVAAA